MTHASTLSFPDALDLATERTPTQSKRPNVWQRFIDALEALELNTPASESATAYAYAFRSQSIPRER